MDYKINLSDEIKVSENFRVCLIRKIKIYYKKHPGILTIDIILVVTNALIPIFVNIPIGLVVSIAIGLVAIFVLPPWKEKC